MPHHLLPGGRIPVSRIRHGVLAAPFPCLDRGAAVYAPETLVREDDVDLLVGEGEGVDGAAEFPGEFEESGWFRLLILMTRSITSTSVEEVLRFQHSTSDHVRISPIPAGRCSAHIVLPSHPRVIAQDVCFLPFLPQEFRELEEGDVDADAGAGERAEGAEECRVQSLRRATPSWRRHCTRFE